MYTSESQAGCQAAFASKLGSYTNCVTQPIRSARKSSRPSLSGGHQ
jgi:hypothetical protein